MKTIKCYNREYPAYPTMGAMRRYTLLTGKDVTSMSNADDMITYLYCVVQAASRREGVTFDETLDDFADGLAVEDFNAWSRGVLDNTGEAQGEA